MRLAQGSENWQRLWKALHRELPAAAKARIQQECDAYVQTHSADEIRALDLSSRGNGLQLWRYATDCETDLERQLAFVEAAKEAYFYSQCLSAAWLQMALNKGMKGVGRREHMNGIVDQIRDNQIVLGNEITFEERAAVERENQRLAQEYHRLMELGQIGPLPLVTVRRLIRQCGDPIQPQIRVTDVVKRFTREPFALPEPTVQLETIEELRKNGIGERQIVVDLVQRGVERIDFSSLSETATQQGTDVDASLCK